MEAALADQLARSAADPITPLWAVWVVRLLGLYLAAGLFFAVAFHLRGMRRVDAGVRGSTWGFRILVTPGVVALWPWLARSWRRGVPTAERNAHRDAAAS